MDTQREALAKHGIDHNQYEVWLSAPDPKMGVDDETTGIRVSENATGNYAEKTVSYSRRQLANPDSTVYIDTIVELVRKLEARK